MSQPFTIQDRILAARAHDTAATSTENLPDRPQNRDPHPARANRPNCGRRSRRMRDRSPRQGVGQLPDRTPKRSATAVPCRQEQAHPPNGPRRTAACPRAWRRSRSAPSVRYRSSRNARAARRHGSAEAGIALLGRARAAASPSQSPAAAGLPTQQAPVQSLGTEHRPLGDFGDHSSTC